MFGVETTSTGLQKFAANRLRQILHSLTKRTFLAIFFGIIMTVAFQSSAASTVLVVEFVNAEMMNLAQALGIVLGSAVGTSISIQLIAFQILDIALAAAFAGFLFYVFSNGPGKYLGQAMIGFGLIFVGMANMSNATAPLKNAAGLQAWLAHLGTQPLLAIVVGLVLTALFQSSTAVFAIMMSLASHHLLNLSAVVPLVIGAHTGGTITTLLSSFTTRKMDAKRAAIANTGYKVAATILVYPFIAGFTRVVQWTTADLQRQVANAHLLFALLMVVIFFPFNSLIAKGLERWLPERREHGQRPGLKYIDESSVEVPAVALKQVFKEICRVGETVEEKMARRIPEALLDPGNAPAEQILQAESEVDWFYVRISHFLTVLTRKGLTEEQREESLKAQFILKELEYTGDVFSDIAQLVITLHRHAMTLPPQSWTDLQGLYDRVSANYSLTLQALRQWDEEIAGRVIREHPEIMREQRTLQFAFLGRPSRGQEGDESEEKLGFALVDLLDLLYRVDEHSVNVARVVMGIV